MCATPVERPNGRKSASANARGAAPAGMFGPRIMALADRLAQHSDTADGLSCTFLTLAHRAVAADLERWMDDAGLAVELDAIGNVIGRLPSSDPGAKTVILGSHYDTVVNAGKYDGRLGILTGLAVIEQLKRLNCTLPFHLELIAFSEEEGVRFSIPYIGSRAFTGRFDPGLLQRTDAVGQTLADVVRAAGFDPGALAVLERPRHRLQAYLEVHIEQGPVLLNRDVPLGVVTAISGGVRQTVTLTGTRNHAGSTPMDMRHDALAAAAEIILAVERRCRGVPGLVGTVGKVEIPNSAINVVAGICTLSLDIRAADDPTRDAAIADIHHEIGGLTVRRGVAADIKELMRMPAVPCDRSLREQLAVAIARAGAQVVELPSGAGHDAVMFDGVTAIGMLFVRCGNGGISHSPLETVTAEDADLAARVLLDVLLNLA
jgi:hydantoinase/carbamoylase family amidase